MDKDQTVDVMRTITDNNGGKSLILTLFELYKSGTNQYDDDFTMCRVTTAKKKTKTLA